jgi:hypothetical protein
MAEEAQVPQDFQRTRRKYPLIDGVMGFDGLSAHNGMVGEPIFCVPFEILSPYFH